MVSQRFYAAFASADIRFVRLALCLLRDMDLRHFRVLSMQRLSNEYGAGENSLVALMDMGFLEPGPAMRGNEKKPGKPTYRIHPSFLMQPDDLTVLFAEKAATDARMTISPVR